MAKNIYVYNLPLLTTEVELHNRFSQHGFVIHVEVHSNRLPNQSQSFGFVVMTDDAAARQAVQAIHRTILHGVRICAEELPGDPTTGPI